MSQQLTITLSAANGSGEMVKSPVSIFDMSRMPLTTERRWVPESLISRAYSARRSALIRIFSSFISISEKPMMALSGVRSSWLMLARNLLFAACARSASARASSIACSWVLRGVTSRITATTSRTPALAGRAVEWTTAHLDPDELRHRGTTRFARLAADPEFDRALVAMRRRIRERCEIGGAVADMHAVEQAVVVQPIQAHAEQLFRGRRKEQHRAVLAVPADHVGHVAGEQPVAVLLRIEQPEAGAGQQLGAKRKPGRIERTENDAERG